MPTISDVSRVAGVSEKTVIRAVNSSPLLADAVLERVRLAVAETGYVPGPDVRKTPDRRTGPQVLLVHDCCPQPHLADVMEGMLSALESSKYVLGIVRMDSASGNLERKFSDTLESVRPFACLIMPSLAMHGSLAGLAWEYGSRCVALAAERDPAIFASVISPERQGCADAVHRLAELGHRRIGFVASEDDPCARQRELGYLDAMAELELDRGPALIAGGDGGFDAGFDAAGEMMDISPAPTAILACTDEAAAGVIRAARMKRVDVPGQLSVVGFGDTPLAAQLTPGLTTVHVPMREMARSATLRLLDPQDSVSEVHMMPAYLIERDTVGAIASTG